MVVPIQMGAEIYIGKKTLYNKYVEIYRSVWATIGRNWSFRATIGQRCPIMVFGMTNGRSVAFSTISPPLCNDKDTLGCLGENKSTSIKQVFFTKKTVIILTLSWILPPSKRRSSHAN